MTSLKDIFSSDENNWYQQSEPAPMKYAADEEAVSLTEYSPSRQIRPLVPPSPGPGPILPPLGPGPVLPSWELPLGPGPVWPSGFGSIRFLYAAANQPPVNITINRTPVLSFFRYSNVSPYYSVNTGIVQISVINAVGGGRPLATLALPVSNRQIYTVAIINSGLLAISDAPCNRRRGMACLRTVNLSANSTPANILIPDVGLLFRQVSFREVTPYQQLRPGNYTVYVTDFKTLSLPVQIQTAISGGSFLPWLASPISLQRDTTYTLYLIGNVYGSPALQALLVDTDFRY